LAGRRPPGNAAHPKPAPSQSARPAQTFSNLPGPYRKRVPPPTLFSSKLLKINKIQFLLVCKSFKINKLFLRIPNRTPIETKDLRFPRFVSAAPEPIFHPNPAPALEPPKCNRPVLRSPVRERGYRVCANIPNSPWCRSCELSPRRNQRQSSLRKGSIPAECLKWLWWIVPALATGAIPL
jgi:hypothetical protein